MISDLVRTGARTSALGALYLCLAAAAGCADWSRGAAAPDAGDAGAVDASSSDGGGGSSPDAAVGFAAVIHPLLLSACQPCHAVGQQAGDTMYLLTGDVAADSATVAGFIDLGAPASSRLLVKMSGMGHGGGSVFAAGSPEYLNVLRWIQEGAPP